MERSSVTDRNSPIGPRLHHIQAGWSADERRQRAEEGRRRMVELGQLLSDATAEPEIWAVGALVSDDLRRLAG